MRGRKRTPRAGLAGWRDRGPTAPPPAGHRGGSPAGHRPSSPTGGPWLYGLHAVAAALANPRRRSRRLIATREGRDALSQTVAGKLSARVTGAEILDRSDLDRLLPPGAVHQGVALEADPLPDPPLDQVLAEAAAQTDAIIVALDQVTDPHNVGAILRSAAAFGAAAVIMPERHAPGLSAVLAKAASGAADLIPVVRVVNLARALRDARDAGFWCVGLAADGGQTLAQADLTGRIALVLGAEGSGLRRLTRETCDITLRVPTRPPLTSLNVSNAAAVALYELARRR